MNTNLWQNNGLNYPSTYQPNYYGNTNQYLNNFIRTEVVKVNGRNGAEAFQLAPNSSALLLDLNLPVVWFVQTDGAGYKTCTPYKVEPYQTEESTNLNSLEARIKRLEDSVNGKSDSKPNVTATNDANAYTTGTES